jgi:tRNA dimethylallyltransferase
MAVYRGMDIGTAKPTAAERDRVPYFGLDLVAPDTRYSVWDFRAYALDVLAHVDRPLLVTGGTGLYVKSLTHGLDPGGGADDALRAQWHARVSAEGLAPLVAAAMEVAPEAVAALGKAPTERRLLRLLEGRAVGANRRWQQPPAAGSALAGLRADGALRQELIVRRVHRMYRQGLVEEVRGLRDSGWELSVTARQAIGYAEAWEVIEGRCTEAAAIERTVLRTRQLAKRQCTWFRTQTAVNWIIRAAGDSSAAAAEQVMTFWRKHGPTPIAE